MMILSTSKNKKNIELLRSVNADPIISTDKNNQSLGPIVNRTIPVCSFAGYVDTLPSILEVY